MAASSDRRSPRILPAAALLAGLVVFCWVFPPFRIKRLTPPASETSTVTSGVFDAKATAAKIWNEQLIPASGRAADLAAVVQAVRQDPGSARKAFGKPAGVGVDYFFVQGSGNVVARERSVLRVAVDGAPDEIVSLRIGPVFGNTVRDGSGLLDVNAFPGLQEFNTLSAELNAIVEKQVLPPLREKANVGATVRFAGCAEVPESAEAPGESLFMVVPVRAEVQ